MIHIVKHILLSIYIGVLLLGHSAFAEQILMVTEATFPPYEYHEGEEIKGIDPEIMNEVAKRMNKKLVVEDMSFDSVITAVVSGKADVAASGITITEERKKQVDFSLPYVEAAQVIVVKKDSAIQSADDLKGKRIGVQHGTTGDTYVTKNIQQPERFPNAALVISALTAGKIDVAVIDQDPAKMFLAKEKELQILPKPLVMEQYAIAVKKGNQELLNRINSTILDLQSTGKLKEICAKHTNVILNQAKTTPNAPTGFWAELKDDFNTNFIRESRWKYLVEGFLITLEISFFSVLVGIFMGFIVAVIRSTYDKTGKLRFLNALCKIYLTVIRGTPVVVQLLIIYFVIFGSVDISKIIVAIVAFGFNSGAYVAEIIRSGIMSIDKGQFEAGRSLGLNHTQTMLYIILPQAFKNVLPALGNEFIVLLKETSVSGYIALADLTKGGDIIRSQTYTAFLPLMAVAIIYLAIVMLFSHLLNKLEQRLKNNE